MFNEKNTFWRENNNSSDYRNKYNDLKDIQKDIKANFKKLMFYYRKTIISRGFYNYNRSTSVNKVYNIIKNIISILKEVPSECNFVDVYKPRKNGENLCAYFKSYDYIKRKYEYRY
ncbi:hypothetical protein MKS88_000572 [Plasmodium brasilianum]|uniref:Uncharacterized protein n=1 Tax=Plasmodium brasilianum TaxID=5824 RepID=A0ACB9YFH7_PLABR|nr:hypothetical protein MKS88_000572 [Plasmodium brasilianum]